MIDTPKNEHELLIWYRLVSDKLNKKFVDIPQYTTTNLPSLGSSQRGIVWDTTLNKPVAWDGSSWNALY